MARAKRVTMICHANVEATIYSLTANPHRAGDPCPACEAQERYRVLAATHPVASVRTEARRLLAPAKGSV